MSENQNNFIPAHPVYFMPPQQPLNNDFFSGFSGILCSILAGLVLGQLGIGFPKLPKL